MLLALLPVSAASAGIVADSPINLGRATSFAVLASSTVTNTGPTEVTGDLGVSSGSSVTGFPPGIVIGTQNVGNAVAIQAQTDVTAAYGQLSALTPTDSIVYTELGGRSLVPGVYTAGVASITGNLTLTGGPTALWVFQVASTLTTGPGSSITITGGANSCNVFWRVPAQATLGTNSTFEGTIIAGSSIAATTGAKIDGRLLAQTQAVTLDRNEIVASSNCRTETPTITSGPSSTATVGTAYSSGVTATGTPDASYSVTTGSLPSGLTLDSATGAISGTPTAAGTSTFTITASNDTSEDASGSYAITVAAAPGTVPVAAPAGTVPVATPAQPQLAATGIGDGTVDGGVLAAGLMIAAGAMAVGVDRTRRIRVTPRHRS